MARMYRPRRVMSAHGWDRILSDRACSDSLSGPAKSNCVAYSNFHFVCSPLNRMCRCKHTLRLSSFYHRCGCPASVLLTELFAQNRPEIPPRSRNANLRGIVVPGSSVFDGWPTSLPMSVSIQPGQHELIVSDSLSRANIRVAAFSSALETL